MRRRESLSAHLPVKKLRIIVHLDTLWVASIGTTAVKIRMVPRGRFTSSMVRFGK